VITGTTSARIINRCSFGSTIIGNSCYFDGNEQADEIVAIFQNESKGEMPVAIIQNGTTPEEKDRIGTINSIQQVVVETII
jgi:uroporphyrin-III C-methyltransferase